ncbi:MAG: phage recombination protein Bet [Rhodospirillales bacterium]
MNVQAQEQPNRNITRIDPEKSAIHKFADRLGVEPDKVMATLKATAFKIKDREPTNEELMALLIVANEHKLNPFTKEIYAFLDKHKGVVPIVSVDGWARIINEHRELDGITFRYADESVVMDGGKECPKWCECTIYRKDRAHPITVREYLDEVYRPPFKDKKTGYESSGPWQSHTKRFLRHKTLIQASRIAFGFSGIYDEDEARRIVDGGTLQEGADGSYTANPDAPPRPGPALPANEADQPPAKDDTFPLIDFNGEEIGEFTGNEWIGRWLESWRALGSDADRRQFIDNNLNIRDEVSFCGFDISRINETANGFKINASAAAGTPQDPGAEHQADTPGDAEPDSSDAEGPDLGPIDFDEGMDPQDAAKALAARVRACRTADQIEHLKAANAVPLQWLETNAEGKHNLVMSVISNRLDQLAGDPGQ